MIHAVPLGIATRRGYIRNKNFFLPVNGRERRMTVICRKNKPVTALPWVSYQCCFSPVSRVEISPWVLSGEEAIVSETGGPRDGEKSNNGRPIPLSRLSSIVVASSAVESEFGKHVG